MAGAGKVNGPALAAMAAGGVLVFAGLKGYSIPATLQDIMTGKNPQSQAQANPITGTAAATGGGASGGGSPGGSTTPSAIANAALRYEGHCYLYGGAPGPDGKSCWDCSSFCNWVLGHDIGVDIPGFSSYDGSSHGPNTLSYLAWAGATTVGHSAASARAGDLCVWQTHMGICTGSNAMISAQNPSGGTRRSGITGFIPGEVLFVRRLKAA